ncbi:MAG: GAF domain-containing protein [Candidatus Koribacter versatilis]|uniref:histidine kinase n=1 Tax=Candidatus Korobacter versatilis TaxID=658062 RepID=A0A932AAP6_9BACT|nr:GAF domain-containing protein [Candidatus Koribacter versatilis]
MILLAGGVLVYRTFRERYLLAWLFGWGAYLLHKLASGAAAGAGGSAHTAWLVLSPMFFTLALFLMAGAISFYANRTRWLLPLAIVGMVALDLAVIRVLWLPRSTWLEYTIDALYMAIKAVAAVELALFSRGRGSIGPWLLTFLFLFVHTHSGDSGHMEADLLIELLLALSMVIIVLDDSQARGRRLAVVNAITTAIAEAQDVRPMMEASLRELSTLMDAKAAWFRLLDEGHLVLTAQVGEGETIGPSRRSLNMEGTFSGRVVQQRAPGMIRMTATDRETRKRMERDGFDHVLVIPVEGKNGVVGTIALAGGEHRSYRPDETQFLTATANQLGIAFENLQLFEHIAHSQRQWLRTFDAIEDGVLVHDEHNRIIKLNRPLLARLRKEYREVVGASCDTVFPNAGTAWTECPYCTHGDSLHESPDPCFPGYSLVTTATFTEEGGGTSTIHTVKDTTERRAVEERYRLFFERVQEGVFVSTPDGRLIDCNEGFVRLLGYQTRDELLAVDIAHDLYANPEDRQRFRKAIAEHGSLRDFEFDLRRKDGSIIKVRESSFALNDAQGRVARYQGFLLDITEKKRAEEEIRRRNRELNALNAIASMGNQSFDLAQILNHALGQVMQVFAVDTGTIYLFDEPTLTLRRIAGAGYASDVGRKLEEFQIPQEFWETVRNSRAQVITQQHLPHLPGVITEFVREEKLQSWVWLLLWANDTIVGTLGISSRHVREFTANEESLLVAIGRQLANTISKVRLYEETKSAYEDLARTQEQLLQSEKMSAIGQLISGVAHELNNPLTAILGYAQLLENEELDDRSRDFVSKLYRQAQRTHKIVQNLLSFSRQRKPQKQSVDLRRVLEETLALRDYDLKLNNIAVEREFESPLPPVTADPHQIEQVFLNIINNAADAMLETSRGGALRVRIYAQEGHVWTEFRDTGPGIRDTKRIFDPFYTTKGVGKGTGLGLSICYGIMKEHQGEISAQNEGEGAGAIIRLKLPVAATPVGAESRTKAGRKPTHTLFGRVLVVDDEEAVVDFEAEVLRGAGAEVVSRMSGEEAIALLQAESFDAIIIDGKMPGGWTGMDVYQWIAENRPGLERCIMFAISNFGDSDIRRFIEEKKVPCIVKPFEVADLIAITRRLLKKSKAVATGI